MDTNSTSIRYNKKNEMIQESIYRIRKQVFVDRLHWNVKSKDGKESDKFDCKGTSYILIKKGEELIGSCRLIPSSKKTMVNTIFKKLLRGEKAVYSDHVYEISRLASVAGDKNEYGILPSILSELREFAKANDVREYIFVTTVAIERMLRKSGVLTFRHGDGKSTSIDGVKSVALRLYPEDLPYIH